MITLILLTVLLASPDPRECYPLSPLVVKIERERKVKLCKT